MCRVAAGRGLSVAGLARHGAGHEIDATDPSALCGRLDAVRPDLVINAAAQTSLDACERDPGAAYVVNAGIVATLAEYCRTRRVGLVQISTDHYFTGDGGRLHDEACPVRLLNQYARSKYAGEAFAATCPGSLVVRTNLVGFRGWPGRPTFVEWALAALEAGDDMTLFDDFHTSSLDVESFSHALLDLVGRGASGLFNLAAREAASKSAFVLALARSLGLSADRCRIGSIKALAGAPRAESLGLDVARAEAALGRVLPDTAAVIAALARSYKEQSHAV